MSFEPKQKVELDLPKDDVISTEYLSKCDGKHPLREGSTTQINYNESRYESRIPDLCGHKGSIMNRKNSVEPSRLTISGHHLRR